MRAAGLIIAAALCLGASPAESSLERFYRLRLEAAQAAEAKDYAKAEAAMEEALAINPASPGALISAARMEALGGKPDEAVVHLAAYANLDLVYDYAGDPAVAPLAARADFAPVAARLAANATPLGEVEALEAVPASGQIIEGLQWRGGGWLASSVTGRKIYLGDEPAYPTSGGPVAAIFGMASWVEDGQVQLWAAEADGPGIPGSTARTATSALLKIDLFSGALLARYPAPTDAGPHQFGDVAVMDSGDVIVSDSVGRRLYRLRHGAGALDLLTASTELGSPQGMAGCGEEALLVADYPTGLHRLDLRTGQLERVGGRLVALAGTDGLVRITDWRQDRRWPRTYAVTQNGLHPTRILQLTLSDDCRLVTDVKTLAANLPELEDMTLAVQLHGGLAFVGNSGWAMVDSKGKVDPSRRTNHPTIYTVPLK